MEHLLSAFAGWYMFQSLVNFPPEFQGCPTKIPNQLTGTLAQVPNHLTEDTELKYFSETFISLIWQTGIIYFFWFRHEPPPPRLHMSHSLSPTLSPNSNPPLQFPASFHAWVSGCSSHAPSALHTVTVLWSWFIFTTHQKIRSTTTSGTVHSAHRASEEQNNCWHTVGAE